MVHAVRGGGLTLITLSIMGKEWQTGTSGRYLLRAQKFLSIPACPASPDMHNAERREKCTRRGNERDLHVPRIPSISNRKPMDIA